MTDTIDIDHWSLDAFEAAGYPRATLFDPAQVTRDLFGENDWRVLELKAHGIEMFDVDGDDLSEEGWAPGDGTVVEYGSINTQRPVGFKDDTGFLNTPERMPSRTAFKADADPTIAFLWPRTSIREFPDFSGEEAVEALGFWGSEGWVPRGTAEAMADAFGVELGESIFVDDVDVEGEQIVRSPTIAKRLAGTLPGGALGPDSDISGHKKRRRQEFHRNLDALKEHYGLMEGEDE